MVTSIKVKFRPSTVDGKEGCIYYQVIHSRTIRQINTAYKVLTSEWDSRTETIIQSSDIEDLERVRKLNDYRECICWDTRRLRKMVSQFEQAMSVYTADDVVTEFRRLSSQNSLERHLRDTATRLSVLGRTRTAETYLSTLSSFMKFTDGEDVPLDNFIPDCIDANIERISKLVAECSALMRKSNPWPDDNDCRKLLQFKKAGDGKIVVHELDKRLRQYEHLPTSKYVAWSFLRYDIKKLVFDKEVFDQVVETEMYGHKFFMPRYYDIVLKALYGNYMEYPPVSERDSWHDTVVFDPETDYRTKLAELRQEDLLEHRQ